MARRNERPEMSKGTAGQSAAPMSRRSFAAAVGATALAVGLTGCAPKGNSADDAEDKTVAKDSVALAQQEELEKFVVTSGYNCCYCTLQGRKRDGKIVYIEPASCPRTPSGAMAAHGACPGPSTLSMRTPASCTP